MGEKQIRTKAERAASEALRPQFDALGDLAIAAAAAGEADALRAAARVKAQQILDDAEAEVARRFDRWRAAWQQARQAGWSVEGLRSEPIKQQQPPAAPKAKRPAARTAATASGDTTSGAEPSAAGRQPGGNGVSVPPLAQSA